MSKLNISGIVKGIKAQTTYLTPIIEAVCNSIDSIGKRPNGSIDIIAIRDGQKSFNDKEDSVCGSIIGFDVIDNGVGFTDANRDSFDTYLSGHKYESGGKGFGRFMYLKYFKKVSIDSYYCFENKYWHRTFDFGHNEEIIENETNELCQEEIVACKTILHLKSAVKGYNADNGLNVIARKLVERLFVLFVDNTEGMPIITLKESDGTNPIVLNDFVSKNDTIQFVQEESFVLQDKKHTKHRFTVKSYKVYFSSLANKVILTAHRREVTNSPIHNYVPEFKDTLIDIENGKQRNYAIRSYVIGKYLDDHVDTERGDFSLAHNEEDIFADISVERIEREASLITKKFFKDYIQEKFQVKKQKVLDYVTKCAPWNKSLLKYLDLENLPMGIRDLDLELKFQQIKFENEQNTRIEINELLESQKDSDNESFEEQVAELFTKVTEEGKNDLAHYVCNRKKVIDLYNELRRRTESGKTHLESELHNLFFPMIKNDREVGYEDHNLWLLDERLVFSKYIASDKVISSKDHEEPDIAIFHNEQSFYNKQMFFRNGENNITSPITIVEFKRPKRTNFPDDENPIQQALRYSKKILNGKYEMPDGIEKVKVNKDNTPVYIYIVCDIVDKIRDFADLSNLSVSPDDEGYFGYIPKYNAYVEIMSFKKVIDDATMRNKIFFHKLGLE